MVTLCCLSRPNPLTHLQAKKTISFLPHVQCHVKISGKPVSALLFSSSENTRQGIRTIFQCSVAEDETTTVPTVDEATEQATPVNEEVVAEQPVSVPVSPSDLLTMFFQAEGTMSEAAIPSVTSALQETEGISNLRVQVVEGIASVELMKQTTIQATGVASNLVEVIQGSGFKLLTLNLSFEDEEEVLVA